MQTGIVTRTQRNLRRFMVETPGAVLPLFAIFLPLILSTTVLSMEYAKAVTDKNDVRKAADAAVLMGARSIAKAISEETGESETELRVEAIRIATDAFDNATNQLGLEEKIAFDVDFDVEGQAVDGELSFVGKHGSLFKELTGGAFRMEIDTKATVPIRERVDFHFVIDNSPSMDVGASAADQAIMIDQSGCAFACHRGNAENLPEYLRGFGAQMRFDVVKDAVATVMAQFEEIPRQQIDIRVAVHTFSSSAEHPIPLTTDYNQVALDVATLDTAKEIWQGGTNYHASFEQVRNSITAADNTPGAVIPSKRFVIILTDGMGSSVQWTSNYDGIPGQEDHIWHREPGFTIYNPRFDHVQGMDPFACEQFTTLENTDVAVMELEYLVAGRTGGAMNAMDLFIQNVLVPASRSNNERCATSPSFVYAANDADEIRDGMEELIDDLIKRLGLRIVE